MNQPSRASFSDILEARFSRRAVLRAGLGLGALAAVPAAFTQVLARNASAFSSFGFVEIEKKESDTHTIAHGYRAEVLLRWGDPILKDAPEFDVDAQTPARQKQQFGYNNDFIAFMPFQQNNNEHGLLCVNHEYSMAPLMFGKRFYSRQGASDAARMGVEMASQGISVVEVKKQEGGWQYIQDSKYNRRITATTPIRVTGPVAGHMRLKTSADPTGMQVLGTFANCAGGVTPWGTVLSCEENFDNYFEGTLPKGHPEYRNHARYDISKQQYYNWYKTDRRFDVRREPHEPNRFGWVVEYDPFDPDSTPVKRTALGRFKHETATVALAPSGQVVVYSGDDEKFQYLYRYVSKERYTPGGDNSSLLDDGTLYVARFDEDGTLAWLPLIYGKNHLVERNGFRSQADVLIETRRAGDIVGATAMDRPEGIAIQPHTQAVYVAMTHNNSRAPENLNPANPRAGNVHGHIIELLPPAGDHAAESFRWEMFLRAGDPAKLYDHAKYRHAPSMHGWLSCPDNLACDPAGNLWVATDGQPESIDKNDGLYAVATSGKAEGAPRLFFTAPKGAEVSGPCFTPDGKTLFLSIMHPGDQPLIFPATRWPDFGSMPPRPSLMVITKKDGGVIGS